MDFWTAWLAFATRTRRGHTRWRRRHGWRCALHLGLRPKGSGPGGSRGRRSHPWQGVFLGAQHLEIHILLLAASYCRQDAAIWSMTLRGSRGIDGTHAENNPKRRHDPANLTPRNAQVIDEQESRGSLCMRPTNSHMMTLTDTNIEAIARRLDAFPRVEVMTVANAILKLRPSIKKMQAKGYSMDRIAAELAADGLAVSARSLARNLSVSAANRRRYRTPSVSASASA